MMRILLELISAFVSTCAFAIVFHAKKKRVLAGGFGGMLAWAFYLIANHFLGDYMAANVIAAALTTIYAEIMARITKTPATVFLIPSMLPLVPGGSLYYTTSALVNKETAKFEYYGQKTLFVALGIAIGIISITILTFLISQHGRNRRILREAQSSHFLQP